MKRILAVTLAISAIAVFSGCGAQQSGSSAPASSAPVSSAPASSAPPEQKKDVATIVKITVEGAIAAEKSGESSAPLSVAADEPVKLPEANIQGQEMTAEQIAAEMDALYAGTGKYENLPIATIETSEGTVKIRLLPEQAPKAVENFVTHAKAGYYDGLTFHRVLNDFMVQGGDPSGNGTGGESIWGEPFADEFSYFAHNFRGALSMANAGPATNGSQFFIVQNPKPLTAQELESQLGAMYQNIFETRVTAAQQMIFNAQTAGKSEEEIQKLADGLNAALTEEAQAGVPESFFAQMKPVSDRYAKESGTPYLDYKHTVFGYVIEGMDVVDKIAEKFHNG